MQLAIDVGNTRTKLGVFDGSQLITSTTCSPDSITETALEHINSHNISIGIFSETRSSDFTPAQLDIPFVAFNHSTQIPISNDYLSPETLGPDRLLGCIAITETFETALVIDIGTCMTFDLVLDKVYKGGRITPGLNMRLNAMHQFTGNLPLEAIEESTYYTGVDTKTSLLSGAEAGMLAEIEGTLAYYKEQYDVQHCVLTGGDAPRFAKGLKNSIFADPHLILKGLNIVLLHNKKSI